MPIRHPQPPRPDAAALALEALAFVLGEPLRAQRFLDLTGLTPADLRASVGQTATQIAVLDFLSSYEPDLTAAAEALGVRPADLTAARQELA